MNCQHIRTVAFFTFSFMRKRYKNVTKACKMVANKVNFHVFEIHTLNANLYINLHYITLNCYPKRGPRGPRLA